MSENTNQNQVESLRMQKRGKVPVIAKTIRRLLKRWEDGPPIDPWLPFPQNMCSFYFGERKYPIPIGALKLLWETEPICVDICKECGAKRYVVAMTGGLHQTSTIYVCTGCEYNWNAWICGGGIIGVGRRLLMGPIRDSEFASHICSYGGVIDSDGKALLKELGIRGHPESLGEVYVEIMIGKNK